MSSIQGFGPMQGMQGMMGKEGRTQALTDDQKTTLQSILSQYDAANLSADDAQSIFEQLREAGIRPGKGLKEAIEAAGFDAEKLRSLAMPEMGPMQGARQSAELTDDQKVKVASILSRYDKDNLTSADAKSIFKELADAGIQPMKGLKEAIEASGFDAEKMRSLAMPQDTFQETFFWASQNSKGINTSALQSLKSILSQFDLTSLSSDQENSLLSELQGAGLLQSGNILNLGV